MVSGNFDPADLEAILAAAAATAPGHTWRGGSSAAFDVFFRLCHERRWTSKVAGTVWALAQPIINAIDEDDIPF